MLYRLMPWVILVVLLSISVSARAEDPSIAAVHKKLIDACAEQLEADCKSGHLGQRACDAAKKWREDTTYTAGEIDVCANILIKATKRLRLAINSGSQSGSAPAPASTTAPSFPIKCEDFKKAVMGKTQEEVIRAVGKPDSVLTAWFYPRKIIEPITGKTGEATVAFDGGGRVIDVTCSSI